MLGPSEARSVRSFAGKGNTHPIWPSGGNSEPGDNLWVYRPRKEAEVEQAQLQRENERLRSRLEQVELIIDVQKNSHSYLV